MTKINAQYPLFIYDELMILQCEVKSEDELVQKAGVCEHDALKDYLNKRKTTSKGKYVKDQKVIFVEGMPGQTIQEYREIQLLK
jgi:hypothetical protein